MVPAPRERSRTKRVAEILEQQGEDKPIQPPRAKAKAKSRTRSSTSIARGSFLRRRSCLGRRSSRNPGTRRREPSRPRSPRLSPSSRPRNWQLTSASRRSSGQLLNRRPRDDLASRLRRGRRARSLEFERWPLRFRSKEAALPSEVAGDLRERWARRGGICSPSRRSRPRCSLASEHFLLRVG